MTNTVFPWTFDAAFVARENWLIDGQGAGRAIAETSTFQTLTLRFRVTTTTLTNAFRPLKTDEGEVGVLQTDDGGFTAVDRANGNNTFSLDPPGRRTPLRQAGDYHVRRYEEDMVSQRVDEWTVEVEFVRAADRTDTPSISETVGANEWGFDTRYGQIATQRVDADFLGTGADGVERFELTTRLTFDQAHVFESALSLLAGQRVKAVPDAPNLVVDETSGSANTLTVTSPTNTVVSDGDYVVSEWSSTRITEAYQSVSLVIGAVA